MTSGSKIAVVMGSSKGIGKAVALAFAKSREYRGIAVNSMRLAEAQQVADEIKSLGFNSIANQADMSKESDCVKLIEETIRHYSRIDVLVNNAGIQQEMALEEISIEVWYKIIGVELTSPFVCSRAHA